MLKKIKGSVSTIMCMVKIGKRQKKKFRKKESDKQFKYMEHG